MAARGRGRKQKRRTKLSPGDKIDLPEIPLSELEATIESTREQKAKCLRYLDVELSLALATVGNDVKVLRLLKGIEDRQAEALVLAARLRQAELAGLAGPSSDQPQDFASLLAAKRPKEERSTA